jgi:hypothetical protein
MRTQFARKNVPSFCPEFRTTTSLRECDYRMMRMGTETNCPKWMALPVGGRRFIGDEMKQKVVMVSLQPSLPVPAMVRLKNEGKIMRIKNDMPESDALTIGKCASLLGVHEFSLLSRIQAGDIAVARLRSGEMAIPQSELARLTKMPVNVSIIPSQDEIHFSDHELGIERGWGGLKRNGESVNYSVPDYPFRFPESEINGYRAAFGAIASEYESLGKLRTQLEKPATIVASSEKEICTSQIGVWQVRSTLLNLDQSNILLCQKQNDFAVIERFRDDVLYAKANGIAEILLERNDPRQLAAAFNANAKHTLEFMASNQVATAQKIIWGQFQEHRPARLMDAISARCQLAVTNEEVISETRKQTQSNGRGMSI